MNHLNTAICETATGDLLILWGGRRIVTRMLVPGLKETEAEEQMGMPVEHVWVRRYRLDSGPLVLTRIYDNGRKRVDYNAVGFGRNPAIIKDRYGRLWVGYRIPIISTQDPFGALSSDYVTPENIGSVPGAGTNLWVLTRADDPSKFRGAWPWGVSDWQEQAGYDFPMFSDFTRERLSGNLYFRGMGGNLMDVEHPQRLTYNEAEGLGHTYSAADILSTGQQIRLAGSQVLVSIRGDWEPGYHPSEYRGFGQTAGSYGISGNLRVDRFGHIWIAGVNTYFGEVPFQVEAETGIKTSRPAQPKEGEDTTQYDAWVAKQAEYAAAWAVDNEKEWVLDNANVPGEGYSKDVTPPTAEEQAAETQTLTGYYYQLPISDQRPGYCISQNGLQYISYLCGNMMAKPITAEGKTGYKAVGLRVAVSRNGGKDFEPLIPERIGYLNHAGEDA